MTKEDGGDDAQQGEPNGDTYDLFALAAATRALATELDAAAELHAGASEAERRNQAATLAPKFRQYVKIFTGIAVSFETRARGLR